MHVIHPYKEIQEAAGCISIGIEALEYVRRDLWCLPREHRDNPDVRKLFKAYHEHAYKDILKWAEKEGKRIDYDGAMEIVVFSGVISPEKNQVMTAIVMPPAFVPQTTASIGQIQALETPTVNHHWHSPPIDNHPTTRKPERTDRPPQKRKKVGQRPGGTHGAETDAKFDPSMLGQQPQVKIVRDLGNPPFQTGDIICLDEHDTLCVQKAYIVMVWIRYRVIEMSSAVE